MNIMQTLVDGPDFSLVKIPTTKIGELDITAETFSPFVHARPIGISPGYSEAGKLVALAIADDKTCTIIEFNVAPRPPRLGRDRGGNADVQPPTRKLDDLQEMILSRSAGELFAFDMGPLCLALYGDSKLRVTNAVDIQSAVESTDPNKRVDRRPLTAIQEILGTTVLIKEKNITSVFANTIYDCEDRKGAGDLAMRAWISQLLAEHGNGAETLSKVRRINTDKFTLQVLSHFYSRCPHELKWV